MDVSYFGIEEGLSHRDVQCIHQDRQGFMWFGTKYGLNRFDGYNFKWFTKEKNGLQSNEINHIVEDGQGRMWLFFTERYFDKEVKSIDIFDPVTEVVGPFDSIFSGESFFSQQDIVGFSQNDQGHLVFVTRQQQFVVYNGRFEKLDIELDDSDHVENIHWAPTGLIWLVVREKADNQTSILVFDQNGKRHFRFAHPNGPNWRDLVIYDLDRAGNCRYLTNQQGLLDHEFYKIRPNGIREKDTLMAEHFARKKLDAVPFDDTKNIEKNGAQFWVRTENTVEIFDLEGNFEMQWSQDPENIAVTTDFYFARDGKIWVGTQFGVYRVDMNRNPFSKIFANSMNSVRGMEVDKYGQLWVANGSTYSPIGKTMLPGGDFRHAMKPMNTFDLPFYTNIYTLLKRKSGDLFYFMPEFTVQFDPKTLEYKKTNCTYQVSGNEFVWSLYEDTFGRIWFGTDHGQIGCFKNKETFFLPPLDTSGTSFYIYQFFEGSDGKIWLATQGGLFTLDTEAAQITGRYWSGGEGEFYFPFDNIQHIHEDDDHSFWLATAGAGLVHWIPQSGRHEQFTRVDGLSNNNIYAVYGDEFDNLWMSSDYGIMRFEKNSHRVTTFLEKDGINHNEFNRISHYQHSDGTLFFGGLRGVTAFHPKDFEVGSTRLQAPLVITKFQQFIGKEGKLVDKTQDVVESQIITLAPNDPFFQLEFAMLTYEDVNRVQYAYQLEGTDQDWQYQKENFIRLSRLPFGQHLLKVKGQNSKGQWSEQELAIRVVVLKPFYLRTWFLVLAALIVLTSGTLFYKWRTATLKRQKAELEKEVARRTETIQQQAEELQSLEKLKSRFFANVSHELRTPLSLMLGPVNSLLKRHNKEGDEKKLLQFVQRNARQLQKLINEILDLSKLEDGKLDVMEEPVFFYPYLKEQLAQFYSAASSDKLNFRFEYKAEESLHILLDKNKFEKILHNYLSNAMKFTPPKGTVTLTVEESGSDLQISVGDTGRGIHPNDLPQVFDRFYQSKQPDTPTEGGTGIGLSLVKELAELLGGSTWVKSELGAGSVFYFRFPKNTASEMENGRRMENGEWRMENERHVDTQALIEKETPILNSQFSILNSPSILIVEDNQDLREYLRFLLSDYKVLTAENGQAALEIMNGESPEASQFPNSQFPIPQFPDLIISDLMMPVMDGFQFLEKVKSDDRWRHLPFIMLTAKVNARARLRALRIGVDDYLTKPFEEEELKARIENLLHNYRERMKLFSAAKSEEEEAGQATEKPVVAQADAEWLAAVEALYARHLADSILDLNFITDKLNMSERNFRRRLEKLTGLSPRQYLQEMRLQIARDYLVDGRYVTVKEACYAVGFSDARHFSELFQHRFGVKPSGLQR